ncbi:MAG: DUF4268 domain-containing protein [Bacteroidota bacterium]|nr:DUF4268 domain-containing protein [Bacteroidota bacterium]
MYSKQEAAQLRQEFWTAFGQYMAPVLSAEGEKMAWVNYKTGEKGIFFRMHADNKRAVVAIELTHKDKDIQQLFFEQFQQVKTVFSATVGEDWTWRLHIVDEYGRMVSRIETEKEDVSIFRKEDWPDLISFFKTNIIALDEFWSQVKYGFESLR